jgi:DDE superfamily endonuclease/Helix-turn-helix of DDE superfamily endonuclease
MCCSSCYGSTEVSNYVLNVGCPANFRCETDVDWAPSLHLTSKTDSKSVQKAEKQIKRDERRKRRSAQLMLPVIPPSASEIVNCTPDIDLLSSSQSMDQEMSSIFEEITISVSTGIQTGPALCVNCHCNPFVKKSDTFRSISTQTEDTIESLGEFENNFERVTNDNIFLREEIQSMKTNSLGLCDFTRSNFQDNDTLVKFYTGFVSFAALFAFFELSSKYVKHCGKNALPKFTEFLLVLIKLRLNVPYKDLSFRFKVDETTASRIFLKWIDGMFIVSKGMIIWPDRATRVNSMPKIFKNLYGDRVTAIIDCFELFIYRPSNPLARTLTWSHYKSHNTLKYLISIAPQGIINFVSIGWGGKVSDKQITKESGFLDYLKPGDFVMADRGFTIDDLLKPLNCSLIIPAFTRGKSQLSYMECKKSREIANLRIHVERIIGLLRNKYSILSEALSPDLLIKDDERIPLIDKIVKVCCALVNNSPSIIIGESDD